MVTSNENKAAILEAAIAYVDQAGAAGLRVDAVAAAAGLNKRLIYHYFGDRQGLLNSVYRDQAECLLARQSGLDEVAVLVELLSLCHLEVEAAPNRTQPTPAQASRAARIVLPWLIVELGRSSGTALEHPAGADFANQMMILAMPILRPLEVSERSHTVKSTQKPVYRVASTSRLRD